MIETASHWHVASGLAGYGPDPADEDFLIIETPEALADEIARELREWADIETDHAHGYADAEYFKEAWQMLMHAEELDVLRRNFDNARVNAPIYKDNPAVWQGTIMHLVSEHFPLDVGLGDRLYVWECSEDHDQDEDDLLDVVAWTA